MLYPVNWIHLLLPVEDWDYVKFLHLSLAACFFYLLAKEFGVGRKFAILCGCCAYGAGFLQGFLAINMMVAGFVWTPLVLTGVERAFKIRRLGAGLIPSAIGTFFLATGFHPGFGVSIAGAITVYVGRRSVWDRDPLAPVRIAIPVSVLLRKRYWDYVGVRYVVVSNARSLEGQGRPDRHLEEPLADFQPVRLDQPVEFPITPAEPVEWIDLPIRTYAGQKFGRLVFELRNAAGTLVISDTRDMASLPDNSNVRYSREDGSALTPQVYTASVRSEPGTRAGMLGLWQKIVDPQHYRYELFARTGPFTRVLIDAGAAADVVRNETAEPILYVAPEAIKVNDYPEGLRRFSAAADLRRTAYMETGGDPVCRGNQAFPPGEYPAEVSGIRVEPNRVLAHVDAKTRGTLTLVSSYSPGWSARINGAPAKVYRVNGALQGACLAEPGRYDVEFSFEPPVWRASLVASAVGWLALLLWPATRRRLRRKVERPPTWPSW